MAETQPTEKGARQRRSRLGAALRALIRARITAGIITILPLLLTLWVVRLMFGWMRDASRWAVQAFLLSPAGKPYLTDLRFDFTRWEKLNELPLPRTQEQFFDLMPWHVQWGIAIFSVLLTVFVLYAVGLLSANVLGRRAIDFVEQLLARVPLIKSVYNSVKQITKTFSSDQPQRFQRVAMFPFMAPGVYSLGFITRVFNDANTGEECVTVFYATTPNPTTGYVLIIRRADVIELDWSIEDTLKGIVSGGILLPEQIAVPPVPGWWGGGGPPGTARPTLTPPQT